MFFSLCIKRYIKTSRYGIYVIISKYYEDGGGGGATQSERTVLHHDGLCEDGVCCVPVPPEAHVYFARSAVAEQNTQ